MRTIAFHFIFKVKDVFHHRFYSLSHLAESSLSLWALSELPPNAELIATRQFTGLKDRSGRDIFEGDITYVRKAKEHREVVFHEGAWCVKAGKDHFHLNIARLDGLDIVGNIYENPELTKPPSFDDSLPFMGDV